MSLWKDALGEAKINNGDLESARDRELSVQLCQSASPFTKSFHETRVKLIEVKENIPLVQRGDSHSKEEVLLYDSIFASSAGGAPDKTVLNNTTLFEYSNPSFHQQKPPQLTSPSVISPPCRLTTSHLGYKPGPPALLAFSLVLKKIFQKQKSACFLKLARLRSETPSLLPSMLPDVSSEIAIVKNKDHQSEMDERAWTNPFKRLHSAQYDGQSLGGGIHSRVCTPALRQVSLQQSKVLDLLSSSLQGGVGRVKRAVFSHLQDCRKYILTRAEGERELKRAKKCLMVGAIIRVLQRHVSGLSRSFISKLETHYITASFFSKRRVKVKSHPSSRLYSPQDSRTKVCTEDGTVPFLIKSPTGSVYDGGSLATTDICFSIVRANSNQRNQDRKQFPTSGRILSYFSGTGEDEEARKFRAIEMIVYLRKLFVAREQIRMTRSAFSYWLSSIPLRMQYSLPRNDSYRLHPLSHGSQNFSGSKLKASMRYYFPQNQIPFYPLSELNPLNASATLGSPGPSHTSFYHDSATKRRAHPYFGQSNSASGGHFLLNQSMQAGGTLGGQGTLSSYSRPKEGTNQCSRSISPIMNQSFEEVVRGGGGSGQHSFNAFHTFAQNSQRRKESVVSMEQCLSPTPLDAQFDTFYGGSGKKQASPGDYWLRQSSQELKEAVAFIKEKLGMQL